MAKDEEHGCVCTKEVVSALNNCDFEKARE